MTRNETRRDETNQETRKDETRRDIDESREETRAKIAFSGLKNEENLLTLNEVPFNRLFHDSTEIKYSGRQVRVVYLFVVLSLEPVE